MKPIMADYNLTTQEIKSKLDIVDIVSETVQLKRRGNRFWGLCPFHQEKTPSFSVDPQKQRARCFGCGWSGDIFAFVMRRDGIDFKTALILLATLAGLNPHVTQADRKRVRQTALNRVREKALEADLETFVANARHECFDTEQVFALIEKHIYQEGDLERPAVTWALCNHSRISYWADLFLSDNPAAQLLAASCFRGWSAV